MNAGWVRKFTCTGLDFLSCWDFVSCVPPFIALFSKAVYFNAGRYANCQAMEETNPRMKADNRLTRSKCSTVFFFFFLQGQLVFGVFVLVRKRKSKHWESVPEKCTNSFLTKERAIIFLLVYGNASFKGEREGFIVFASLPRSRGRINHYSGDFSF